MIIFIFGFLILSVLWILLASLIIGVVSKVVVPLIIGELFLIGGLAFYLWVDPKVNPNQYLSEEELQLKFTALFEELEQIDARVASNFLSNYEVDSENQNHSLLKKLERLEEIIVKLEFGHKEEPHD